MDYQQPHGYMRPPPPPPPPAPPSAADPFQRPQAPVPPPPSNHPWPYSAPQFHYQPQTQHSPSPPPPQWPPPHSSDHTQYHQHHPPPPYPAHQPPPYSAHPHPHYPPPPPLPPRPPHVQSYSQDWGSGGWSHHQSWQYPTNNNEEDWAAKAKAWAAAKSATDNQHTPSQFLPAGRPEEQNHFHDHHSTQPMDPQFLDGHTSLAPSSNYHQYPGAMPPSNKAEVSQLQDFQYMNSGQSSYAAATHVPFAGRDGGAGDSFQLFQQEKSPISSLVHQQEVPSSYSSVPGSGDSGDRYEKFNSSSVPVHSHPQHHIHQGRSGWMEEPHLRSSQPAVSVTDLSDQPLSFAPHFNRDPDAHVQSSYTHPSGGPARGGDPTVGMSSNYAWAPSSAPGTAYPPGPPTMPLGPQVDHPITMSSPASGHSAPMFPSGPGFQPTVPMIGAAFGVGAGVTPHPTAFPGDAYGVAERPKKASVPNWLREEIIKKKTVITSSAPDLPNEDSQSNEDDNNDRSSRKGDQAESKSIESSRSTEDEDEDEDEVEAARTAAINKEIKRVLTEVLLKVTDELFDEIATKVLKEDDLSVEVGRDTDLSNPPILPSAPSVLTPKASAKVLIPTKTKENNYEDASDKSTSGSRGDVLGLASYASDEEDEDMQSSGKPNPKESSNHPQSSSNKLLEGNTVLENGGSLDKAEEERNGPAELETNGTGRTSAVNASSDCSVAFVNSIDNMAAIEIASTGNQHSSKRLSGSAENELRNDSKTSKSINSLTEKVGEKNEKSDRNLDSERWIDDDSRDRSDKNDRLENKKSLLKKEDEEHRRREDRHARMGRSEHYDNSKDKGKEKGRSGDNVRNSESRKRRSPSDDKEATTETQRARRTSIKDSDEKRKDRAGDEKKERSRHKSGGESSGHKRRSSSVGARDREGKDNSVPSHANASSDESSDDSKRKSNHSRRHRSPSPSRRRKRQVSRSPHSKHSKRKHSPYSSLETTRGRRSPSRSRSRSPVHRRR